MTSTSSRQALWHWFLLTRPWNVLSMGIMVWLVMRWLGHAPESFWTGGQLGWLLVPMLVGAAGNVINDYIDIREDRINKPAKTHIGRTVKRRVAMASHWGLSLVALGWSAWLSSRIAEPTPWLLVAGFTLILTLYSPMLKGRGARGNAAISLCVGGLVLWGAVATLPNRWWTPESLQSWAPLAGLLAGINFVREWVKDVQDLKGDHAAGHATRAAKLSERTNRFGVATAVAFLAALSLVWMFHVDVDAWGIAAHAFVAACALLQALRWRISALSPWLKILMATLFVSVF